MRHFHNNKAKPQHCKNKASLSEVLGNECQKLFLSILNTTKISSFFFQTIGSFSERTERSFDQQDPTVWVFYARAFVSWRFRLSLAKSVYNVGLKYLFPISKSLGVQHVWLFLTSKLLLWLTYLPIICSVVFFVVFFTYPSLKYLFLISLNRLVFDTSDRYSQASCFRN